jgi:hypothetical protein
MPVIDHNPQTCDMWKQPWLKKIVPSHPSALQLPDIPLPPQFCDRALPDPATSKACGADSDREFLWSDRTDPSQIFPDELKRNGYQQTWDTARWILMFLGRLAITAIPTKCKQDSLDAD